MKSHRTASIRVLLGLLCSVGFAQSTKEQEIVTDRPDITESSIVVPAGSLVVESGFTWARDHGKGVVDLSESLVRLGLGNRTELRFGLPCYHHGLFDNLGGRGTPSGFDDVSFGVKEQIGPLPGGIDLAVIVAVSFPTGASARSTHGVDPVIKLPWSRELPHGWSFGGMQSLFYQTENGKRNPIWEPTFYLERRITRRSDGFVEYGGDFPHVGGSLQVIHFGMAYRVTPKQQIDFHFGFGLSSAAPKYFVAAGYSFQIDKLFRALWR
ncbi:MAG TPA: transporter [Candidatus Acidoferrales bacterium]|nr:transporter [Candidatus Acidoferrales bacterium]